MFNKPNVFNRNEPITRRDTLPIPGPISGPSAKPDAPALGAGVTPTKNATNDAAAAGTKDGTQDPVAPQSAAPAMALPRESPANDKLIEARLLVGPDVKLKGAEIQDCDTLVVEGRVEATMDSRVIRIAESGAFVGKVSIDIAEIHGTFEGELTARCQLIIHSTGRVRGKIRYGKLVVDEGGELCGEINVLSEDLAPRARSVREALVAVNNAAS